MLEITPSIQISENELHFEFIRASGPGGQNVNKVASAVQLRFNVGASSLPEDVKARLIRLAGKRVSMEGMLLVEAKQFRTQERNRAAALQRFVELARKAAAVPRTRKKTRPTVASKDLRLQEKKRRAELKKNRRGTHHD